MCPKSPQISPTQKPILHLAPWPKLTTQEAIKKHTEPVTCLTFRGLKKCQIEENIVITRLTYLAGD